MLSPEWIIAAVPSPLSNQTLQPLDAIHFRPLSSPYNYELDILLQQFQRLLPPSKPNFPAFSSLPGYAEEWLRSCSTLRAEVKDSRSTGAQKLGQATHLFSNQLELLNSELPSLRQKLYPKEKRQNHSKQIDLKQHRDYHGGAL